MVQIFEDLVKALDLVFCTDTKNPEKSKTICIAFPTKNQKEQLADVKLNGNVLYP